MNDQAPNNLAKQASELKNQEVLSEGNTYRMWEDYASPYSAKMRAYLRYKNIPYQRMRTSWQIYTERIVELVGMSIIPVILTPDNQVMQDSTPMIEWFEQQYPAAAVIPEDPGLAFLSWLVEDFADEYMVRLSVHFRWNNELNRQTLSHRIARTLGCYGQDSLNHRQIAQMILARQSQFIKTLGLETQAAQQDVDQQLFELLTILEEHFKTYSFLFGDKPSVADFALYGHLWAHLWNDPYSANLMEMHGPQTCFWLESITDFGDTRGNVGQRKFGDWIHPHQDFPATLKKLFHLIAQTYVPLGIETAKASLKKEKWFTTEIRGIPEKFSAYHYRAWSFEQTQLRFQSLDKNSQAWCRALLEETGLLPQWMEAGILHNGLFDGLTPPFVKNGIADNRIKHLKEKQR